MKVSAIKGADMVKKYIVRLSEAERQYREQMVTTGKRAAYTINHAPSPIRNRFELFDQCLNAVMAK